MDTLKTSILSALRAFIRQRPGLEFGNYGDVSSYRSEMRSIARDRRDAETLLRAVEWRDSITGAMLLEAFPRAYSGRLKCTIAPAERSTDPNSAECGGLGWPRVRLEYCTGQYFPTEYRKAAAAVLASALWDWTREHAMPAPDSWRVNYLDDDGSPLQTRRTFPTRADADHYRASVARARMPYVQEYMGGKTPGDWLRSHFRNEFGRAIAARYFN